VTLMAKGQMKPLYDGNTTAEMFAESGGGIPSVETNLLVARADWYKEHQREARFYLALWERGLQEWKAHRREIVEKYPDDFSIKEPGDVDAFEDFLDNEFNWVDEEATLDQEFIDSQAKVFDLMKSIGAMEPNVENPKFDILEVGQP